MPLSSKRKYSQLSSNSFVVEFLYFGNRMLYFVCTINLLATSVRIERPDMGDHFGIAIFSVHRLHEKKPNDELTEEKCARSNICVGEEKE